MWKWKLDAQTETQLHAQLEDLNRSGDATLKNLRRFDEAVLDGPEWMVWAEKNLSAREFELLRLADGSGGAEDAAPTPPAA